MNEMAKSNKGIVLSGSARITAVNVVAGENNKLTIAMDVVRLLKLRNRRVVANELERLTTAIEESRSSLDNSQQVEDELYQVVDALRKEPADRPRVIEALENLGRVAGAVATVTGAAEALKTAVESLH